MEVGKRDTRGGRSSLSQINVTPFVDVMLVLLIIFMVTAPMMEKGLDVNLPEVAEAPDLQAKSEPLLVSLTREGTIHVDGHQVEETAKLIPVLRQILDQRKEKEVFLEADRTVPYGQVVQVMAAIRQAGVTKLGMVAETAQP